MPLLIDKINIKLKIQSEKNNEKHFNGFLSNVFLIEYIDLNGLNTTVRSMFYKPEELL